MSKFRIGFLGLGIMGSGMARRLAANGFPLAVYNRNAKKAEGFAEAGARVAASPRDAAAGADVVMCMVADDTASRSMWLGDNGALSAVKPGTICIDSSTISVGWARELAAAVEARKCEFLDTPVTGSKAQAASGEFRIFSSAAKVPCHVGEGAARARRDEQIHHAADRALSAANWRR